MTSSQSSATPCRTRARNWSAVVDSSARYSSTEAWKASSSGRLRTSPTTRRPPGATRASAPSSTASRYRSSGKYCTTELSTTVSKSCSGRSASRCAAHSNSSTCAGDRPGAAMFRRSRSSATEEMSVPQYRSQCGAARYSSMPVPQPMSSTDRGAASSTRSAVAPAHSRISSAGIGAPV
nr:hypothetical protein [Streptomyces pactum]